MPYTIITQPNCPSCQKAKQLLKDRGLSYQEFDLTDYKNKFLLGLMRKSSLNTVPQIWGPTGEYVGGFEALEGYHD